MKATKTMHVDANPEQVISFLLDSTATPRGMTMKAVYESPGVVGNSYEWAFNVLGIPRKGVTVYTDYVPGKRLAVRNFGAMEGTATYAVEPDDGGGSNVTVQADSRLAVPVIWRFFDPFLQKMWERNTEWAKRELNEQAKLSKATA